MKDQTMMINEIRAEKNQKYEQYIATKLKDALQKLYELMIDYKLPYVKNIEEFNKQVRSKNDQAFYENTANDLAAFNKQFNSLINVIYQNNIPNEFNLDSKINILIGDINYYFDSVNYSSAEESFKNYQKIWSDLNKLRDHFSAIKTKIYFKNNPQKIVANSQSSGKDESVNEKTPLLPLHENNTSSEIVVKRDEPREAFHLTDENWFAIMQYLSIKDMGRLSKVNRFFNSITDTPEIWKDLFIISFPIAKGKIDSLFSKNTDLNPRHILRNTFWQQNSNVQSYKNFLELKNSIVKINIPERICSPCEQNSHSTAIIKPFISKAACGKNNRFDKSIGFYSAVTTGSLSAIAAPIVGFYEICMPKALWAKIVVGIIYGASGGFGGCIVGWNGVCLGACCINNTIETFRIPYDAYKNHNIQKQVDGYGDTETVLLDTHPSVITMTK